MPLLVTMEALGLTKLASTVIMISQLHLLLIMDYAKEGSALQRIIPNLISSKCSFYLSFQLLYPLGDNSPIANFLEKNKAGGMHHICIEVSVTHRPLDDIWEISFHKSSFWFKQVQSALRVIVLMILYKSAVNDISVLVHVKFGTEFLDQWWPSFMMSLSYSCCDGYIKLIMP